MANEMKTGLSERSFLQRNTLKWVAASPVCLPPCPARNFGLSGYSSNRLLTQSG